MSIKNRKKSRKNKKSIKKQQFGSIVSYLKNKFRRKSIPKTNYYDTQEMKDDFDRYAADQRTYRHLDEPDMARIKQSRGMYTEPERKRMWQKDTFRPRYTGSMVPVGESYNPNYTSTRYTPYREKRSFANEEMIEDCDENRCYDKYGNYYDDEHGDYYM